MPHSLVASARDGIKTAKPRPSVIDDVASSRVRLGELKKDMNDPWRTRAPKFAAAPWRYSRSTFVSRVWMHALQNISQLMRLVAPSRPVLSSLATAFLIAKLCSARRAPCPLEHPVGSSSCATQALRHGETPLRASASEAARRPTPIPAAFDGPQLQQRTFPDRAPKS